MATLCLALGALSGRAQAATRPTPEIPKILPMGYLVLPFENGSGAPSLEWMRVGLPMVLAEKLEAHPGLRPMYGPMVLPGDASAHSTEATEVAAVLAAARRAGAKFVFTGWFARPEWKLELRLRLWSVEGDLALLVGEEMARGDFADCFGILGEETLALLEKAGRSPPAASLSKLKRNPTRDFYAFTLYGRGVLALHGLGKAADLTAALKNLSRSVFIDPKYAEAHRMLALVYQAKGQPARARGQLSYALDLRPDYYAALAALVQAAHLARQRGEAILLSQSALRLRPWDLDVRFLLGEMLWEDSDIDGAYLELSRVVEARPDHLPARRILVLVHATKGDGKALAGELEDIIRLDPGDEAARLDLGAAYRSLGRTDDAIAMYTSVVGKNPKHLQALKFLGDLHEDRGDLARAISYYEQALAAHRNDPRAYFLLGAAYVKAGDDRKALHVYRTAQKFRKYLGETYNNLGSIHYRQGQDDVALWYLSRAAQKRPLSAKAHYNYGLVLSRAQKRDHALSELTLATELEPSDADIHFARGVVLLRLGRVAEAEAAFKEAVRVEPAHEAALHNLQMIDEMRRRATEGEIRVE